MQENNCNSSQYYELLRVGESLFPDLAESDYYRTGLTYWLFKGITQYRTIAFEASGLKFFSLAIVNIYCLLSIPFIQISLGITIFIKNRFRAIPYFFLFSHSTCHLLNPVSFSTLFVSSVIECTVPSLVSGFVNDYRRFLWSW